MDFISKQFYRTIKQEFPDLGSPRTNTIHQIPWCWQACYMVLLSVAMMLCLLSPRTLPPTPPATIIPT